MMNPKAFVATLIFSALVGSAQAAALSGQVLEVKTVDSYTYLLLKTASGDVWAAVPATQVSPGAQVSIGDAMMMQNFQSKALGKTFDRIAFGTLSAPAGAAADGPALAPANAPAKAGALPHAMAPVADPALAMPKVPKARGPGAKTVAEVVGGAGKLKNKTVLVRGQVVKFNAGILGKNWVHLRDGSGSADKGSNDILVTTQQQASVGDIVDVKGTVRTNIDLGAGYVYAVIIEGAALSK